MAQIIKGVSPEREAYLKGQQERGITLRNGVMPQREQYLNRGLQTENITIPNVSEQRLARGTGGLNYNGPNVAVKQSRVVVPNLPRVAGNALAVLPETVVTYQDVRNGNLGRLGNVARVAEGTGRIASTIAGGEIGAGLGTMVAPGVGTVAGGLIGGGLGYVAPEATRDLYNRVTGNNVKLPSQTVQKQYALGGIVKANQALYNQQYKQQPNGFPGFENMTTDMPTGALQDIEQVNPKRMSIGNALALQDSRDNSFDNMTTDGYKKGGVVKSKLGAMGKTIKGPGTGTSDSIDADLPVGSAIIPASVLKLYGEDFFDKLEAIADASQKGEETHEMDKGEQYENDKNENRKGEENRELKQTLGMKCGGVAKMKDGGIARNYAPVIQGTGLTSNNIIDNQTMRDDMTAKSQGFYGNINGSSDAMQPGVTEYSIGVGVPDNYEYIPGLNPAKAPLTLKGKSYYDAPSIVPGMDRNQLNEISQGNVSNKSYTQAEDAAFNRQMQGKPVFAKPTEPVSKYKDGGIVPAKVSNKERYMTPQAVKFFGKKFVNTLIHAKPNDVKEEMGEVKGGKVYAAEGKSKIKNLDYAPDDESTAIVGGGNIQKIAPIVGTIAQGSESLMRGVGNAPSVIGNIVQTPSRVLLGKKGTEQIQQGVKNAGQQLAAVGRQGINSAKARLGKAATDYQQGAKDYGVLGGVANYVKGALPSVDIKPQPTAQVQDGQNIKNIALPTASTQPLVVQTPILGLPPKQNDYEAAIPDTYAGLTANAQPNTTGTKSVLGNPSISVKQSQQPYSTRLGNMGDKVNTINVADKGQMQFADDRTLMPEQTDYLKGELARNADPAFKERLAKEAETVNQRMAWAKQNDLERNARLGNAAAASTLKAQSDTQQAQLGAQVAANKLGYDREADAAKLAQEKELKQRELDIQENKPIVTDIRNPEGIVTGQNVLGRTKDKEGKVSYNNLAQNATDKDAEVMQLLSPEERTDMYNNSILTLQDKKIKPNDPKYKASINFLKLHDLLFPQNTIQ